MSESFADHDAGQVCVWCGKPIPPWRRTDAKACSQHCKARPRRYIKKERKLPAEKDVPCVWSGCRVAAPHEHRGYSPTASRVLPPGGSDA